LQVPWSSTISFVISTPKWFSSIITMQDSAQVSRRVLSEGMWGTDIPINNQHSIFGNDRRLGHCCARLYHWKLEDWWKHNLEEKFSQMSFRWRVVVTMLNNQLNLDNHCKTVLFGRCSACSHGWAQQLDCTSDARSHQMTVSPQIPSAWQREHSTLGLQAWVFPWRKGITRVSPMSDSRVQRITWQFYELNSGSKNNFCLLNFFLFSELHTSSLLFQLLSQWSHAA